MTIIDENKTVLTAFLWKTEYGVKALTTNQVEKLKHEKELKNH